MTGPVWSAGFTGKTYYDNQCQHLQNIHQSSLADCKSKCEARDGCNAINHHAVKLYCVLRKCPTSFPEPKANAGGHVGYTAYKMQGMFKNTLFIPPFYNPFAHILVVF